MKNTIRVIVAGATILALRASAQGVPTPVPRVGDPVFSMGQPPKNQLHGAVLGIAGHQTGAGPRAVGGVHRAFLNPVSGIIGVTGEGFLQGAGGEVSAGVRVLATSRVIGLSAGLEQTLLGVEGLGLAFSWQTAIRRGGIFRGGSMVRVDWLPRGDGAYGIGITVPLSQKFAGRTRERVTAIRVDNAGETVAPAAGLMDPATELLLTRAGQAATQLAGFTNLYTQNAQRLILTSPTRDYPAVLASYHASIRGAFIAAAADSVIGQRLERDARAILLDGVLLPFNSSFGQAKKGSGIGGLTSAALRRFLIVVDSTRLASGARARVEAVFTRWLRIVEETQADGVREWKDTRKVWLPLQLALTAEEFDDQAEVDDLIARAVGHPFSDQNGLAYLNSNELPLEIARTIYAARDYHVLWTHDFAGHRFSGTIDNIGYAMVADVYLPALTQAVKRYDSTGVMPLYLIMLDQYFYEPNNGRLWMTVLENPLEVSMRDARVDPEREAHLNQRQRELRAAVEASSRLRAEQARGIDPRYIVKVHVNVTLPADFSFRSKRIIPGLEFTPDNLMRDHRKIVFYDVNESDPYRGAMILMGVGIGEHYASPTWEDRGYRIRGPAALEARRALRRTLDRLGIPGDKVPLPLRATEMKTAEQQANTGDYIGRALQIHNTPGFGPKESSVGRAALYNLAAPGSTIIAPDPLWLSETWAGMLTAAAARGSTVMIIAPAVANAPSPQPPLMALSHRIVGRLLVLQRALTAQNAVNGGELRVGLYAAEAQIDDAAGRAREVREGVRRAPWIRSIIPFDETTLAVLENVTNDAAAGQNSTRLARDEKPRAPQLHQKTQLIALPGAMTALLRQPGWRNALAQSIRAQAQQTVKFTEQLTYTTPDVDTTAMRRNDVLLTAYEASRPEAERNRVSFYFSVGTQNQDDRGLASDGEASVIVSGFHAAAGVVDLYNIMARSRWITTQEELDRYIPPPPGWLARIAYFIRATL